MSYMLTNKSLSFHNEKYCPKFLFHEADPGSWPVVITIFALLSVRPSPLFKTTQNKTIFKRE